MFARIIAGVAHTLRDQEMSVAQLAAMALVDQASTLRVSELAEGLQLSVSAASRLVDALVERGMLSRTEDPDDRRARRVQLTTGGKKFMDHASSERVALIYQTIVRHVPTSVVKVMLGIVTRIVG
jgi:DNA-binding MarR family transcriptional regulator